MPSTGSQPNSSLRDNRTHRGTVGDFLKSEIQPGSNLSFVSAYFTVHAYEALAPKLEGAAKLRFLFGEPSFVTGIDRGDKEKANFKLTERGITIARTLTQRPAAKACAEWIERMVEIRSIRQSNFLHGKAYHIENGNASSAILGSSNFTVPGLGLGNNSNVELNPVVDSDRDRRDLKSWFNEVWDDDALTKDVRDEVLTYLRRLASPNSPQFIYFLTLFHLFRDELESNKDVDEALKRTTLLESHVWKMLYSFQRDGAKGVINKLLEYNGCILADSVGLGKTFEALAVIKYFELRNERVLVLCPKKLRPNWTVFKSNSRLNPLMEDGFGFDVLSHTDLSRTSGLTGAFADLCDAFDGRNANGTDMIHESALLDSAVESIKRTFARRATSSLLSGRDGLLPMASETPASSDDLELVTWLVIMGKKS